MGKTVTVTIEKLAGLGDGQGLYNGRKIFIPYTMAGDVVEAELTRSTADADYAALNRVLTPAAGRTTPVCRHFGVCGGCTLQHVDAPHYTIFKTEMARAAVRKAGFSPDWVAPLVQFAPASRRRADLAVGEGKLGYFALQSHNVTDISQCCVLEPGLEALILQLNPLLLGMKGIQSVHINGVDGGYDMLLEAAALLHWPESAFPGLLRVSQYYEGKPRLLYQAGAVELTLGEGKVTPPPGAFLQAVRAAQEVITQNVLTATREARHVLDLFCGLGTYSLPLLAQAAVTAVEGDASMVQALRDATVRGKHAGRLTAQCRDLFRRPFMARELGMFDAVVINPPRSGAAAQCKELMQAKVPMLVMISCNPATFARDARLLREGGYVLRKATPIDQFAYSPHLEIIGEFAK